MPADHAEAKKRRKPNRSPHEIVHCRVKPGIKTRAARAAAARGLTLAQYVELLIEADTRANQTTGEGTRQRLDLTG